MTDMRTVIIPRSDQLNSDDLLSGPRTVKITSVAVRPGTEQPVAISFDGDGGKPYKPCKSMCRVMVSAWGADAKEYAGRSMTLYRDPKVKWAGLEVGGIRISHMSHIERDHVMALTESKQSRKPFIVKPLSANPPPPKQPAEAAKKPPEPGARAVAGQANGKAQEARDRFMARLEKCPDLGELADLQVKLGEANQVLGEHYQECAKALEARQKEMMGGKDHHDAFAEIEPDEWKNETGRVEDDRAGELPV